MAATSLRAHTHTPLQTINRGSFFMRPLRSSFSGKQKSAVELLQESKCLYVKSETVLDHRQQLKSSSPDRLHSTLVKVRGPPVPPKSAQLRRSYNSSISSADQLQAKLRKLLNADSKENLIEDSKVCNEVRRSPQHYRRSNSQKQPKTSANQTCPVHHKSLPDLHKGLETSSDSSEPASCEYQLYTGDRKFSSRRQSTNDDKSGGSSTKSKPLSSQGSMRSRSQSGSSKHNSLAVASPVNSSVSFGGSPFKLEIRRPDTLWSMLDDGEAAKLRPILRSKSDVGRRPGKLSMPPDPHPPSPPPDLDTFFSHLGLTSPEFQSVTKPSSQTSSPVFFSDTSSVDSLTLAANHSLAGSEGTANTSLELPSIVERNARIIKWLCNCRKAQLTPHSTQLTADAHLPEAQVSFTKSN